MSWMLCSKAKRPHRTHTEHCRLRLHKAMMESNEYRERMGEVENRENRWLEKQVELADQGRVIAEIPEDYAGTPRCLFAVAECDP